MASRFEYIGSGTVSYGGASIASGDVVTLSGSFETKAIANPDYRLIPDTETPTGVICFIGTSLVNQGGAANTGKVAYTDKSWFTWAQSLSGWKFECPIWYNDTIVEGWEPSQVAGTTRYFWGYNAGVSGQTAQQIYDRREMVKNIPAEYYFLDMGTNDIGTLTGDQIHTLRKNMVDYLVSYGKKVIIAPILARSTSAWASGGDQRKVANYVNHRTPELADAEGVYVFDWNRDWKNQDDADGQPKANYSADGTHFSALGAYNVGLHFKEFLDDIMPDKQTTFISYDDVYDATLNPYGNSMANPDLDGTTGANTNTTGDVADGMRFERVSGAGTGVASKVASSTFGNSQRMVMTCQGSAGTSEYNFRTGSANVAHSYAGKWVVATALVDIDNTSGQCVRTQLIYDDNLSAAGIATECYDPVGGNYPPLNVTDFVLKTPPLYIQPDSTSGRWRMEIEVDDDDGGAGTATVTVDVKYVDLREVTSPITRYGVANPS